MNASGNDRKIYISIIQDILESLRNPDASGNVFKVVSLKRDINEKLFQINRLNYHKTTRKYQRYKSDVWDTTIPDFHFYDTIIDIVTGKLNPIYGNADTDIMFDNMLNMIDKNEILDDLYDELSEYKEGKIPGRWFGRRKRFKQNREREGNFFNEYNKKRDQFKLLENGVLANQENLQGFGQAEFHNIMHEYLRLYLSQFRSAKLENDALLEASNKLELGDERINNFLDIQNEHDKFFNPQVQRKSMDWMIRHAIINGQTQI